MYLIRIWQAAMERDWDHIDVSRKAHELSESHGLNAPAYAFKLARTARDENAHEEAEFWQQVAQTLLPRNGSATDQISSDA